MFSIQVSLAIIGMPSSDCSTGLLEYPAVQLQVDGDTRGNEKDKQSDPIATNLKTACENGMKNASRLVDVLVDLTVEYMWLDESGETFDRNSNLRGHIAKVCHTAFTMMQAFKPYIGVP